MSRSLIVFRRPALPARIAPIVLRLPTQNLLAPAGLGLIENLPPVRAIDLLK